MRIVIEKKQRLLRLMDGETELLRCRVALGREPLGHKQREGDGRTPEGSYTLCLVKEQGKWGRSLGLSYPNAADAAAALADGRIDENTCRAILTRLQAGQRPPWGTPLGGEIYIHEGGSKEDWTQGCIALDEADMDRLFPLWQQVGSVQIQP